MAKDPEHLYHIERAQEEQMAAEAAHNLNVRDAHRGLSDRHADEAWSIGEESDTLDVAQ